MQAAGKRIDEIETALELSEGTVDYLRQQYRAIYLEHLETARALIRIHGGTPPKDPREVAKEAIDGLWQNATGQPIPEADPATMTLTGFFGSYFVPTRLAEVGKKHLRQFGSSLRKWREITEDPPLAEITNATMALFRNTLGQYTSGDKLSTMSTATVRKHLRYIQSILDQAGPPGPKHLRTAAGILEKVPYAKPPRPPVPNPQIVTLEMLEAVYRAAERMNRPVNEGIRPADWWKALIVVAVNTGLRRGTLMAMQWDHCSWENRLLMLPEEIMKSRRRHHGYLNQVAITHLSRIRGAGVGPIFPFPYAEHSLTRWFQQLQELAGIPKPQRFGFHALRRTLATWLWEMNPQAAQFALGHTSAQTTMNHYVSGGEIVARALDALPQPKAFLGHDGKGGAE